MYPFGKGLSRSVPYLLLVLPIALYVIFYVGPSIMSIVYSFTNVTNVVGKPYHFVGLDNYDKLFFSSNSPERWKSIGRTLYFTFTVTIIQNIIGLFVAVIINQKLKGDKFYRSVLFLPVVLGVTVVALVWTFMMDPINGPVQKLYKLFDYSDVFFGSFDHAFNYVIFVQIWQYMGYSMLIFLAGLQSIPKDLYESGYIDGTNKWQSFKNITFPLIAPAFTVNVLLSIIGAMQTFDIIYALTKGNFNTRTIAFDVYREIFGLGKVEQGLPAALSVVQFLLILVFVVIAQYVLRKREVEL
ncbi:carbohydrate ABC transporter permease [Paenibacillus sp. SI8]|uniref:carbohydrate ABC transporter permease n=1 Tax=unclassified Paenibacillus TaxID=185978 RepID=UPI003467ECD9